ncbi:Spc97 / Spc98 family of spindle pole body (SBP) component [Euphorbia peplus]|nr:Spc97 / Spc98 family of spindle pole body (SBP) component [Euphorbia peplus]
MKVVQIVFWSIMLEVLALAHPYSQRNKAKKLFFRQISLVGKGWENLLNNFQSPEKESTRKRVPAVFEIPLDFIIDKCLLQEILLQYCYVSKLAIKLLAGFDLHEHLLALRQYHLMESAEWADLFIKSLPRHVFLPSSHYCSLFSEIILSESNFWFT